MADYNVCGAQIRFQRNGIKSIGLSDEYLQTLYGSEKYPENIDYEGTDLEKKVTNMDTLKGQLAEFI
jgi:type I site-specific restriction endonuclease